MENPFDSLEICSKQCMSKCCKSTPPALTRNDISRIDKLIENKQWRREIEFNQKKTEVVAKKENGVDCLFLSEEGLCKVYDQRPLDCRLFPLFIKIKKQEQSEFQINWLVWYCPLTNAKELELLRAEAKEFLIRILTENPEELYDYQESMYISGGYKKKHFFKEERLKI